MSARPLAPHMRSHASSSYQVITNRYLSHDIYVFFEFGMPGAGDGTGYVDLTVFPHWKHVFIFVFGKSSPNGLNSGSWNLIL